MTEAIFGSLSAGGAVLVQDLAGGATGGGEQVLLALLRRRGQLSKPVRHGLRTAARAVSAVDYPAILREKRTCGTLVLGAIGLFLLNAPELGTQVLAVVALAGLFVLAAWLLGRFGVATARRHRLHRAKALALGAGLVLVLAGLTWAGSLLLPVNLFVGACFLYGSWVSIASGLEALNSTPRRLPRGVALFVNAGVTLLFGVVALSTPEVIVPLFVAQIGRYLIVVGLAGLALTWWDGVALALERQGSGAADAGLVGDGTAGWAVAQGASIDP